MKYSEEELNIIHERRPDLRRKTDPSINDALIEFLRKYDLISQLSKNSTVQEWSSLKKQALDHKDFPKFQTEYFNEVIEHNQIIDKKLGDPQTQKELDLLFKKYAIKERIRSYINPVYFSSKYKDYSQDGEKTKPYKITIPSWLWLAFSLSIVLIIFSFRN
tara:strand:+ start:628 stop:1110 length:483 start_codon:yes stop_codon:yes gene_type:complete